jgi:hypothetical protein
MNLRPRLRVVLQRLEFNPLSPQSWGEIEETGGHPQTLGRKESLHSLGISDLEFGDAVRGFVPLYAPVTSQLE